MSALSSVSLDDAGLASAALDSQALRVLEAEQNGTRALVAVRDRRTDRYLAGWISPREREQDLHPISSRCRIKDLFAQHNVEMPNPIPSVDFVFEPTNDLLYDHQRGFVNRFTPSRYLRNAQSRLDATIPPTIERLIRHALGDTEAIEHFLNWFAVLFRYRDRTQTAWILHGTTGTGKGLLFHHVMRPLIGPDYCRLVSLANLAEQFNAFVESTILLFIDEVDTDQVKNGARLMARLKTWITEAHIPLRAMRKNLREVPNHLNLVLSSNHRTCLAIEANDRRFNVAPRQERKLLAPRESSDDLVAQLGAELQDFADYLMSCGADRAKARQALDNEPKRLLQPLAASAMGEVAMALRQGNLGFFMNQRGSDPSGNSLAEFEGRSIDLQRSYGEFLAAAVQAVKADTKHVLQHEVLFAIFELLAGGMERSKRMLTGQLDGQGLSILPHTQGQTSKRGLGVRWKAAAEQLARWTGILDKEKKQRTATEVRLGGVPRPQEARHGGVQ